MNMEKMLACEQVRGKLDDFLHDWLTPSLRGRMQGHLLFCSGCLDAWGERIDVAVESGEVKVRMPKASPAEIFSLRQRRTRWERLRVAYKRALAMLERVPEVIRQRVMGVLESEWELLSAIEEVPEPETMRQRMIDFDPLFSFVSLGITVGGPDTKPFFYTVLRVPPQRLAWQRTENAEKYRVTIHVMGVPKEILTTQEVAQPDGDWVVLGWPTGIKVAAGREYIWQSQPIIAGYASDEHTITGKFWLTSAEDLRRLKLLEPRCAELEGEILRAVALATLRQEARLYDEAIRGLLDAINKSPDDPLTIPARRALGNVYNAVLDKLLAEELRMFDNAINWVSERGKEQLKLIYCLLLGNYARYERGECEICNECGLIR
jgi:hypothetical protein